MLQLNHIMSAIVLFSLEVYILHTHIVQIHWFWSHGTEKKKTRQFLHQ